MAVAMLLLSATLIRRFLREGFVLRSLVWPAALTVGTLVATLLVFAAARQSDRVGITPDLPPAIIASLEEAGWQPLLTREPERLVRSRNAWAATDGTAIWHDGSTRVLQLESILRDHRGAPWRPENQLRLPSTQDTGPQGAL